MAYLSEPRGAARSYGAGLGCACQPALGDTAVPVAPTPEGYLQQQINRFAGPAVPQDVRYLEVALPVTGIIDMGTAIQAVLIAQRRAADAFARYRDNTSTDILATANTAFADPIGYTVRNLGDLTLVVSNYADAKGLPKPGSVAGAASSLIGSPKALALAGGAAIAAFLLWRGR